MVFYSSNQPHQGNQEQEDAHSDDHTHHSEAGDEPKADAPSSNPDEQQTDQGVQQVERAQAVLGAREAPAHHRGEWASGRLRVEASSEGLGE